MIQKTCEKNKEHVYVVFRVIVGLLFFMHGAQKLFGWFGSKGTVPLMSLFGVAGVIELLAGILITIGLFTRLAALVSAVQMIAAYAIVHVPQGLLPYANGGELAVLYFAAFLAILANGSGTHSLDAKWRAKQHN